MRTERSSRSGSWCRRCPRRPWRTPLPGTAKPRALPPPAKLTLPGIPVLAGLGTLMLASLTGVTVLVITRRGRRAGNPPAG